MRLLPFFCLLPLLAQPVPNRAESPTIAKLLPAAVDAFWTSLASTPLFEPAGAQTLVTFLWRGEAKSVQVMRTPMTRLPGSNLWHATFRYDNGSQAPYSLVIDGKAQADPRNPVRFTPALQRPASVAKDSDLDQTSILLVPPAVASPWLDPEPGVPAGKVEERTLHNRRIWIYTPPGYDTKRTYDLVVFFDGSSYLDEIPLPTVLDNLQAKKKIRPVIALLVDNSVNRLGELANSRSFADFLAGELLPWAHKSWNFTSDPHRTLVAGYSAGGLAAGYVAYRHPEVFGNVFSQSGAYWRGNEGSSADFEWVARQIAASPKLDIRFYLEVGGNEIHQALGSGPVFRDANRRLVEALKSKGYEVAYREVPAAQHEPVHWRNQLPDGLLHFLSTP